MLNLLLLLLLKWSHMSEVMLAGHWEPSYSEYLVNQALPYYTKHTKQHHNHAKTQENSVFTADCFKYSLRQMSQLNQQKAD